MALKKSNFSSGDKVTAAQLNAMEDNIEDLYKSFSQKEQYVPSNWDTSNNIFQEYVNNKPVYYKQKEYSWNGIETDNDIPLEEGTCWILNSNEWNIQDLDGSQIIISSVGKRYLKTLKYLDPNMAEDMEPSSDFVYMADYGLIEGLSAFQFLYFLLMDPAINEEPITIGLYCNQEFLIAMGAEGMIPTGFYSPYLTISNVVDNATGTFLWGKFNIIFQNKKYINTFDNMKMPVKDIEVIENPNASYDFSRFPFGTILMVAVST